MKPKRIFSLINFLAISAFALSSCSLLGKTTSTSSVSSDTSSYISSDTDTSTETSSTTDTSTSQPVKFVKLEVFDSKERYLIGDKYSETNELKFVELYSDGSLNDVTKQIQYKVKKINPPSTGIMVASDAFSYAGKHEVFIDYIYDDKAYEANVIINVLSGFEADYTPVGIKITNAPKGYNGSLFIPVNELKFDITWDDNIIEHVIYDTSMNEYDLVLYNSNDSSKTNLINSPIDSNIDYVFEVRIKNTAVSDSCFVEVFDSTGYIKAETMSITSRDVNPNFCPAEGTINVLVIPIELDGSNYYDSQTWTQDDLMMANNEFFGTKEQSSNSWNSFKSYYETASFNKLKISGMVSELYVEDDPNFSMAAINADTTFSKLFSLINRASNWVIDSHPEIDWTTYDQNNDGCLDAVHLIHNGGENSINWADPLWPHMASTGMVGTHNHPSANVYSISSLGHFDSARTQIHEQGHIFGLEDYYDYTPYSSRDYVGGADMQSYNIFDWNSYSKLSMGWVKPYVVDGTLDVTTITMSAASINGDCLIIPSNYSTWNGSAFDEYFLIELFSPFNNNEDDWMDYADVASGSKIDLGQYGVRMYHVDSRLWGYDDNINRGRELVDYEDLVSSTYENKIIGVNNSYDASSYATESPNVWSDYKLLTIIQAGKVDTLGTFGGMLDADDLFQEGDVFNFKDYNKFLSKKSYTTTTMDNGEVFPYQITFKKMSIDEVTIEIRKI